MTQDDLDRILSTDEPIVPASGFAASVMDEVRREASAPPPIPFPWLRLASGILVVLGAVALVGWSGVAEPLWDQVVAAAGAAPAWPGSGEWALAGAQTGAGWVAGALLVALASCALPLRLARRRA